MKTKDLLYKTIESGPNIRLKMCIALRCVECYNEKGEQSEAMPKRCLVDGGITPFRERELFLQTLNS